MSQVSPKSTNIGNQDDSRTHAEEASSQMPRVQEPRVDQEIIVDAVPINMVLPSEGSTKKKKTKRTTSKKRKGTKKGSSSGKSSKPDPEPNVKASVQTSLETNP
ncbi:hypothetical protein P8452_56306 [Trifolium repens]|jgi:hypothetical protein|nr:hypothetical protein P8452_56306 [Trifolium repens]